jgi:hypothetical protein
LKNMKILTVLLGTSLLFPIALVSCDSKPDIEDQDIIGSLIKHGKDGCPGKNGQNGQNGENGQNGGNGGKGGNSDWGRGGDGGNGGDVN